jgi:hypothetical protein
MEDHLAKQRLARTRELVADSGLSLYDARRKATKELRVPKETSLRLRIADSFTANVIGVVAVFFALILGCGVLFAGCVWFLGKALGPSATAGM